MFIPQKYERTGLRRKMNCTELSSGKISWERWHLRWSLKEGKKFSGHSWDLYSLGCISIVKTWGQETLGAWDTQEDLSEEPHSSRTQGPWGRTARSRMERECRAPWSVVSSKSSPHAVCESWEQFVSLSHSLPSLSFCPPFPALFSEHQETYSVNRVRCQIAQRLPSTLAPPTLSPNPFCWSTGAHCFMFLSCHKTTKMSDTDAPPQGVLWIIWGMVLCLLLTMHLG